jgi:hypothetical protein
MPAATSDRNGLARGAKLGIVGGMVGAMVMAMYAMVASVADKHGFFTPLYHIASAFLSPTAMTDSMGAAMQGDELTFRAGPALVGLVVHMVTGAMAGAMFGAAAVRLRLSRGVAVVTGGAFGLMVLVVSGFVGLPVMASVFGGGDAIRHMPKMVGWGTFSIEHLLYGLVLGGVVAAVTSTVRAAAARPVGARAA